MLSDDFRPASSFEVSWVSQQDVGGASSGGRVGSNSLLSYALCNLILAFLVNNEMLLDVSQSSIKKRADLRGTCILVGKCLL